MSDGARKTQLDEEQSEQAHQGVTMGNSIIRKCSPYKE